MKGSSGSIAFLVGYGTLTLVFGVVFLIFLAVSIFGQSVKPNAGHPVGPDDMPAYKVVRVIDGDTVVLDIQGHLTTCRLIGVDAPEVKHPFGPQSASYLKWWIEGRTVRVSFEKGRFDRYGRMLVYIWSYSGKTLVNLDMVRSGHAEFMEQYPTMYRSYFEEGEELAKSFKLGLWKPVRSYPVGTNGELPFYIP